MMHLYKKIMILSFFFLLIGCGVNNDTTEQNDHPIELTNISTKQPVDQTPSNQAKQALSQYDGITSIKAVNTKDKLLVAVEIEHQRRFQLEKTEKKLTKKMKDQFSNMKVEFSTDQKINLELEKLEKELKSGSMSKKELTKQMNHLIKLTKEKT